MYVLQETITAHYKNVHAIYVEAVLIDKTFPPLSVQKFQDSTFFCVCIGLFVSDLVRNPENQFSRVAAHLC